MLDINGIISLLIGVIGVVFILRDRYNSDAVKARESEQRHFKNAVEAQEQMLRYKDEVAKYRAVDKAHKDEVHELKSVMGELNKHYDARYEFQDIATNPTLVKK